MNRDIIFIVGLPGSGKTTLAKTMVDDGFVLIDDFCVVVEQGDPSQVLTAAGSKVVITDPKATLVDPLTIKAKLEKWGGPCNVRFIAFENDVDACWRNVMARTQGDAKVCNLHFIKTLSTRYNPDDWGEVVPVWKG